MSEVFDQSQVPGHCPGTKSQEAGKVEACAGCPNQRICSSGALEQVDNKIEQIRDRLRPIKHKILVMSGKGGVGKSTITSLLARTLAKQNFQVAVLDVDICGPSQPTILGVEDEEVHKSGSGWSPVYVNDNLSVMSIGFLLSDKNDSIIWRGPKKNTLVKQFLCDVDWGILDFLIIDTPPGTSDEHLSSLQCLSQCDLTGAVIVTTSQEVALIDVRKQINFCRKLNLNIIGIIENMKEFICPNCKTTSEIFINNSGGPKKMCSELNLSFLGSLSLDSILTRFCDEGRDIFFENYQSDVIKQLMHIVDGILESTNMTITRK